MEPGLATCISAATATSRFGGYIFVTFESFCMHDVLQCCYLEEVRHSELAH